MTSSTASTEPRKPNRSKIGEALRRPIVWVITAAAGAAIGVIVPIFVTCWVRDCPPMGDVSVMNTTLHVTKRMFYGQANTPEPGEPEGLKIQVKRQAENVGSHSCRLNWSFLDANGSTPVTDNSLLNQLARDLKGGPSLCTATAELWVPLDARLATYSAVLVQIDLRSGDNVLSSARTQKITLG